MREWSRKFPLHWIHVSHSKKSRKKQDLKANSPLKIEKEKVHTKILIRQNIEKIDIEKNKTNYKMSK